jgi:chloramphenicol-sensitive protein RarD
MADQQYRRSTGYDVACGISAYGLWGLIPLYFKTVADVAPAEVLAHRVIWSFVMLVVAVRWLGRWDEVRRELRTPKLVLMLALSATMIAANWLTFIYAITSGQVLQSSLGYFISPLVCVLLGVVFLRERLSERQTLAIGLATVGLLVLAGVAGQAPWIAMALALTSAFHVLIRKIVPVDGLVSLTVETTVMIPIALAYLGYLTATATLTGNTPASVGRLMLAGPVTTIPFLFYGFAVKRLRLSTMGILEYLTPSLQLLLAVVAFKESFATAQLVSFACVWTAIAIYTADSYRAARRAQLPSVE